MKMKCLDGSVVQTYGIIEAEVQEGNFRVRFPFHLLNKQVYLVYDGILVKDFLQKTKANFHFVTNRVTFAANGRKMTKRMPGITGRHTEWQKKAVRLPRKSELAEFPIKRRWKQS
jgi:hypothetical protein